MKVPTGCAWDVQFTEKGKGVRYNRNRRAWAVARDLEDAIKLVKHHHPDLIQLVSVTKRADEREVLLDRSIVMIPGVEEMREDGTLKALTPIYDETNTTLAERLSWIVHTAGDQEEAVIEVIRRLQLSELPIEKELSI